MSKIQRTHGMNHWSGASSQSFDVAATNHRMRCRWLVRIDGWEAACLGVFNRASIVLAVSLKPLFICSNSCKCFYFYCICHFLFCKQSPASTYLKFFILTTTWLWKLILLFCTMLSILASSVSFVSTSDPACQPSNLFVKGLIQLLEMAKPLLINEVSWKLCWLLRNINVLGWITMILPIL